MDPYRPRRYSTTKPGDGIHTSASVQAPQQPTSIPHLLTTAKGGYAEWRVEPPPTNRALREVLRGVPWTAKGAHAVLCVTAVLAGWQEPNGPLGAAAWIALVLSAAAIAVAVFLRRFGDEQDRSERLDAMRDYGATPQFPVTARFYRGRQMFDYDFGLVSLIDCRLYYIGEATTFSFSPRAARLTQSHRVTQRFVFLRYGKEFSVEFTPDSDPASAPRFPQELHRFINARISEPSIVEMLPPTRPSLLAAHRVRIQGIRRIAIAAALISVPNLYCLGGVFQPDGIEKGHAILCLSLSVLALSAIVLQARSLLQMELRFLRELADEDATYGVRRA